MGFNEKMTTLADAIRDKTNQTKELNLDEMATSVASIEVGGENVTDETTAYTAKLASLETAISDLETELQGKASGGSGGGGIETCIVDLDSPFNLELERLAYSNGNAIINISAENIDNINDRMSLTIAKNSILFVESNDNACSLAIEGDAELISAHGGMIIVNIAGDCSLDYELMLG